MFLNPVDMQLYLIHRYFIELQILRFFCHDSARKNARAVFILWCIEYCLSSDKTTYDWCKQFKTFIHDIVTSHRFCVHSILWQEWTQNPWLALMEREKGRERERRKEGIIRHWFYHKHESHTF